MSEFAKDSLSLEETNKLRISLGLKPLSDDSAAAVSGNKEGGASASTSSSSPPPKDKDTIAEENYRNWKADDARQKQEAEIRDRIAKAQNKRDLRRQLRGRTLGQAEEASSEAGPSTAHSSDPNDAKSTLKWLKQTQKRAKEHAARRAKQLEEQEAAALQAATAYGESDLSGLRVGHDVEDFDLREGDEQGRILTLRDSKILDGDEDELMDASLEQREIDRRNQERKKGPKEYNGLDDDEMDEDGAAYGRKRGVLSKYDADIQDSGVRPSDGGGGGFRLGGSVETPAERKESKRKEMEEEAKRKNRTLLSLDYAKNQEISDYAQPGEVGFKKSKTKKKKRPQASRIKLEQDDEDGGAAPAAGDDVEMAPAPTLHARRRAEDRDNLVDDDELAASLAKARRAKAKKAAVKMTPEEIARNLAAQKAAEEQDEGRDGQQAIAVADGAQATRPQSDGLTFDATSEFIRNIAQRPSSPEVGVSRRDAPVVVKEETRPAVKEEPRGEDLPIATEAQAQADTNADGDMDMAEYDAMEKASIEDGETNEEGALDTMGTSAEPSVASGISGTLRLLQSQGLLEGASAEQRQREAAQKSYDAWKARHMAEEALKEQERTMSKLQGSAKDQATREYENKLRELEDARRAEARFKDYKPDVDIKYHDQHGRVLNNHEAWKLLSHTFHGKMPGRAKQEKYRKKVEEERKRERMAAGDSHDMSKAFLQRQQREGQAHMVLSVGVKGNAPQDFAQHALGPNLVHQKVVESGTDGKGKKSKATSATAQQTSSSVLTPISTPMLSPPLPKIIGNGNGNGPIDGQSPITTTLDAQRGSATPGALAATPGASASAPVAAQPRMKPAFAPIGGGTGTVSATNGTPTGTASPAQASTPVMGSGFKLAFGAAGNKRKAEEQGGRR